MDKLLFWHWWILATLFVVLEILAPAAFFLWLGIAAVLVGLSLYFFPTMGWELQVLIYAGLSAASIIFWKRYINKRPRKSEEPHLNRRGQQYVGQTFTLDKAIEKGTGKIQVDGTWWKIKGTNCPEGSTVKVTAVDGFVFSVEPVSENNFG